MQQCQNCGVSKSCWSFMLTWLVQTLVSGKQLNLVGVLSLLHDQTWLYYCIFLQGHYFITDGKSLQNCNTAELSQISLHSQNPCPSMLTCTNFGSADPSKGYSVVCIDSKRQVRSDSEVRATFSGSLIERGSRSAAQASSWPSAILP